MKLLGLLLLLIACSQACALTQQYGMDNVEDSLKYRENKGPQYECVVITNKPVQIASNATAIQSYWTWKGSMYAMLFRQSIFSQNYSNPIYRYHLYNMINRTVINSNLTGLITTNVSWSVLPGDVIGVCTYNTRQLPVQVFHQKGCETGLARFVTTNATNLFITVKIRHNYCLPVALIVASSRHNGYLIGAGSRARSYARNSTAVTVNTCIVFTEMSTETSIVSAVSASVANITNLGAPTSGVYVCSFRYSNSNKTRVEVIHTETVAEFTPSSLPPRVHPAFVTHTVQNLNWHLIKGDMLGVCYQSATSNSKVLAMTYDIPPIYYPSYHYSTISIDPTLDIGSITDALLTPKGYIQFSFNALVINNTHNV
jgi:hypothetical protein